MRIQELVRQPHQIDEAALARAEPETLARFAIDRSLAWWQRVPCVRALAGRIPPERVAALLERVRDPEDVAEVRIALLAIMGDRKELLPWLQSACAWPEEQPYGMYEAMLATRASLGDISAAPELTTLANHPWPHHREQGERALDELVAKCGMTAIARVIDNEQPENRVFGVRMRSRAGEDVVDAFADPDAAVAWAACECVIETGIPDDERLVDYAITGPSVVARAWALHAVQRRGREIRELWHALAEDRGGGVPITGPRVEVPGLPEDIRRVIVHAHEPEPRSDPRWLLERVCTTPPPADPGALARAMSALRAAGLVPGEPRSIGEVNAQGGGTYDVIELAGDVTVDVCDLGPYVRSESTSAVLRAALESAGFRWIDDDVGSIVVTHFRVYYFGSREPLDVNTLLFYWQD